MQVKLMEASALSKLIGAIGRQRVSFDTRVQQAAFECVAQSIVHRNITPAQQLLDVVGAHVGHVLVAYFEMFGNIAWMKSDKKLGFYEVKVNKNHAAVRAGIEIGAVLCLSEAYAETIRQFVWTKAKREIEPKTVFDVSTEVDNLFDRLVKFAKKGGELKNRPLLDRLMDTYNHYSAETFLASTKAAEPSLEVQISDAKKEMQADLKEKAATPTQLTDLATHFNGAEPKAA